MALRSLTPMLQTSDMDRTVAWYLETLDFRCVRRVGNDWCHLERDGVSLMFMQNAHVGAPHATATQYIHVDDVDAVWDTLKHRVPTEWGPEVMPYGMREFAIKDPDGYYLSFGEPLVASGEQGDALLS